MDTLFAPLSHLPTLEEILANREARVKRQRALIAKYKAPLVSFTVNMPGPVKENKAALLIFNSARAAILAALHAHNLAVLACQEHFAATGFEVIYSVDAAPLTLKQAMIRLEDEHPLGRLFDSDVIKPDGFAVSRTALDNAPDDPDNDNAATRRCFICASPATHCARSRQHSMAELHAWIGQTLARGACEQTDLGD